MREDTLERSSMNAVIHSPIAPPHSRKGGPQKKHSTFVCLSGRTRDVLRPEGKSPSTARCTIVEKTQAREERLSAKRWSASQPRTSALVRMLSLPSARHGPLRFTSSTAQQAHLWAALGGLQTAATWATSRKRQPLPPCLRPFHALRALGTFPVCPRRFHLPPPTQRLHPRCTQGGSGKRRRRLS